MAGLPTGTSSTAWTYLFGPRIFPSSNSRISPYAQVLFGGERLSASVTGFLSAASTSFAMTFGGGLNIRATNHVSIRPIQTEYLYTKFGTTHQNNLRIQSGLVYRFGR